MAIAMKAATVQLTAAENDEIARVAVTMGITKHKFMIQAIRARLEEQLEAERTAEAGPQSDQ